MRRQIKEGLIIQYNVDQTFMNGDLKEVYDEGLQSPKQAFIGYIKCNITNQSFLLKCTAGS